MGTLIVVDCEAPFGVGAPSVGDMTEFGAVGPQATLFERCWLSRRRPAGHPVSSKAQLQPCRHYAW
jgi:hypothetical protein